MPKGAQPSGGSIEIVLADDHPLIRGGLRRVLEREADLTMVGEAADVDGALDLTLTMEAEPAFARQSLAAGARGYVLKEAAEAELVDEVRAILAGRTYLDPSLGARMTQMGSEPGGRIPSPVQGDPQRAIGSDFA